MKGICRISVSVPFRIGCRFESLPNYRESYQAATVNLNNVASLPLQQATDCSSYISLSLSRSSTHIHGHYVNIAISTEFMKLLFSTQFRMKFILAHNDLNAVFYVECTSVKFAKRLLSTYLQAEKRFLLIKTVQLLLRINDNVLSST
jgi:hypothetical protein